VCVSGAAVSLLAVRLVEFFVLSRPLPKFSLVLASSTTDRARDRIASPPVLCARCPSVHRSLRHRFDLTSAAPPARQGISRRLLNIVACLLRRSNSFASFKQKLSHSLALCLSSRLESLVRRRCVARPAIIVCISVGLARPMVGRSDGCGGGRAFWLSVEHALCKRFYRPLYELEPVCAMDQAGGAFAHSSLWHTIPQSCRKTGASEPCNTLVSARTACPAKHKFCLQKVQAKIKNTAAARDAFLSNFALVVEQADYLLMI
jgi:hypothetical protein